MRDLLTATASRASRFLDEIQTRRVGPSPDAVAALARFQEPVPEHATDPAEVIALLDELGSPATMGISGPRFFGFVIGGSLPTAVAANWLATTWDQNATLHLASPVAAAVENVALDWLVDILGLPAGTGAAFVTGATVANFTALAAARHAVLERIGWDVESRGLFGAPEIDVVISDEAHPSMIKALGMLGMGRDRVIRVPTDSQGRMIADRMPALTAGKPTIVCLQSGNVNTGAFDPAPEIIRSAKAAGAWVHVDGAFGLWAAASPALRHLTVGVDQADSWATDAHKWLNVPFDSGLAFVRDPEVLRGAMSMTAPYLPESSLREPAMYVPELSRRARGIDIWAAIKSIGRGGLAEIIDRNCASARRFADGLREAGYEILNDVVLNQVLVSFGNPEATAAVIRAIQEDGTCWVGPTVWQGRNAMRISVSSWRTTETDVELSLEAMLRAARSTAVAKLGA